MSLSILFVDDDYFTFQIVEEYTDGKRDWKYKYISCAETLLSTINISEYDIIITEWHMPGINGIQLCDIIKKELKLDIPIILLSAYGSEKYINEGLEHADVYLVKPVRLGMIIQTIDSFNKEHV